MEPVLNRNDDDASQSDEDHLDLGSQNENTLDDLPSLQPLISMPSTTDDVSSRSSARSDASPPGLLYINSPPIPYSSYTGPGDDVCWREMERAEVSMRAFIKHARKQGQDSTSSVDENEVPLIFNSLHCLCFQLSYCYSYISIICYCLLLFLLLSY